jgi:fucose permease
MKKALKSKITWIGATYFFIYFGTQGKRSPSSMTFINYPLIFMVKLAGWIISILLRVRHASRHTSRASATGFQARQTVGRAALGLATNRIAISDLHFRLSLSIFMACAIAPQLIFWLVPSMIVSAVAVAFLGFFLGPLFPAGVVMVVKLRPKHLHVSSIGFATALGGTGGAIFPFAVGAIAQAKGVEALQPVVLALLLGVLALWIAFPRKSKRTA